MSTCNSTKSSFTYGTYGLDTGIIQLLTPLAHNFDNKFIKNVERSKKITIFHNLNTTVGVRFMVSKFWKRADEFYSFFTFLFGEFLILSDAGLELVLCAVY